MKSAVIVSFNAIFRISFIHASLRRQKIAITIAAAAAALALAVCGGVRANTTSPTPTPNNGPSPTPAVSTVNIPTWHMDNGRSGLNSNETQLTPANVTSSFGKLFSYPVDGYAYAQPLYISNLRINGGSHNVVFVATEMASVYAFDADNFGNGSPLWKASLLQPGEVPQPGGNPKPAQGLTSTPVIDPVSGAMYLVTAQQAGGFTLVPLACHRYHHRAGTRGKSGDDSCVRTRNKLGIRERRHHAE